MKLKIIPTLHRTDVWIALLLLAIVLISKAPTLSLPYHWDEAGAYVGPTHWLNQNGIAHALPGHHPKGTFFGHPPGFYVSLALWFRLVGESILGTHLFAVGFGFLGIYYTYLLGCHLENRTTGLIAALLLFGTPIYFAQSGIALGDVPITALGVMSVYYALRRQLGLYLICSIYMVMMKETSLAIVVALVMYLLFIQRHDLRLFRKVLPYGIPLLVLGIFFFWQKMATGSFFPNPFMIHNKVVELDPYHVTGKTRWVFQCLCQKQNRWILSSLILVHFILFRRSAWRQEYFLFALIGSLFLGAFSFIFFMTRYLLPVMPYLCLAGAMAICALGKTPWNQGAVTIVILLTFVIQYFGTTRGYGSFDNNMEYTDMVQVNRQGCAYIEKNLRHTPIITIWPVSQYLQLPYLGYVKRAIPMIWLKENLMLPVIYVYNPLDGSNKLLEHIREKEYILLKRFDVHGKYLEIYVPPAQPKVVTKTTL